jgi:hypothetical protein
MWVQRGLAVGNVGYMMAVENVGYIMAVGNV